MSSVTHSVDMEQRYVPLSFSTTSTGLSVTAPTNANAAPPGWYLLALSPRRFPADARHRPGVVG